jgi:FemAB-related protein (PEP-CTERM system-associated)
MHRLGTPVYSRAFFEVVQSALRDVLAIVVVRVRGNVEAAAITIRHGRRIEVAWAAATTAAMSNAVNMRMYWEMLKRAIEEGSEAFDFGRCTLGSGTHRFKAQWGATPHQLHWYYWLRRGNEVPQLNNANPRYAFAVSVWQRMPLWCANLIGPRIAGNLP